MGIFTYIVARCLPISGVQTRPSIPGQPRMGKTPPTRPRSGELLWGAPSLEGRRLSLLRLLEGPALTNSEGQKG